MAADDLLALTNVETPLKGGFNTPLHSLDFRAPGSTRQIVATPNTVLRAVAATPQSFVESNALINYSLNFLFFSYPSLMVEEKYI